jgi:hypothetical protein
MSSAKQTSDVEDTSEERQTTHGSVGPTDPLGVAHREVNTILYRLEASLWTESFEFFSDIPRTSRILYTGSSFRRKRQRDGRNIGRLKIYGFLQIQFVFVCLGLSPLVDVCFAALANINWTNVTILPSNCVMVEQSRIKHLEGRSDTVSSRKKSLCAMLVKT